MLLEYLHGDYRGTGVVKSCVWNLCILGVSSNYTMCA